ncbi:hypothetical protein K431DRAFT_284907 [Polychaeton citri CBS 116435]|uniref:Uncharacterized protein n=1 Tax=Polychaeton citri CBS 116435 TaxID=1314669 RepID=A0A9P4UQR0_9PEZI|nr:hypothetical protein K431DRAFT_284907 [Polychaeton citri CBS 116435]
MLPCLVYSASASVAGLQLRTSNQRQVLHSRTTSGTQILTPAQTYMLQPLTLVESLEFQYLSCWHPKPSSVPFPQYSYAPTALTCSKARRIR